MTNGEEIGSASKAGGHLSFLEAFLFASKNLKNQTKKRPPTKFQSFIGALPYETRLIGRTWHLRPMAAKPPLEPNHAWLPLEARGWLRLWLGGGSSVSPGIFYSSASRAPRLTPRALPHARDALDAAPSFDRSTVATRGHESDVRRRDVVPRGRAPGEMPLLEEGVVERLYSQDARQRRMP